MKKKLVVLLLVTLAAVGCASQPSTTELPKDFLEWSKTPRAIYVTGSGYLPDSVVVTRESQVLADAGKGAAGGFGYGAGGSILVGLRSGSPVGFALGLVAAPFVGGAGMIIGGVAGAADSEPTESVHPSSELPDAPVVSVGSGPVKQNLEQLLVNTIVSSAAERTRTRHALQPLPKPSEDSDFHGLLTSGRTEGILVLRFTLLGFVHQGALDADDPDPALALTMHAEPTLYFLSGGNVKDTTFNDQVYEGAWHRVSDLIANNGDLLRKEMRRGVGVLTEHLIRDLFEIDRPTDPDNRMAELRGICQARPWAAQCKEIGWTGTLPNLTRDPGIGPQETGTPSNTSAPHDFAGWSRTARIIAVTDSGDRPDAILLTREHESQVLGDAAKGAGRGFAKGALGTIDFFCQGSDAGAFSCLGGLLSAPFVGGAGMFFGGIDGAATSDGRTVEAIHPLSDLPQKASAVFAEKAASNLEEMLVRAVIGAAGERTQHTLRLLPESPKESGFHNLLTNGRTEGVLVLHVSQLGFLHHGALDPDEPDPQLALIVRVTPDLYFLVGDRVKKTTFSEHDYEGELHKLSELTADSGRLLSHELKSSVQILSDRVLTDLLDVGDPERHSEEYHADVSSIGREEADAHAPPEESTGEAARSRSRAEMWGVCQSRPWAEGCKEIGWTGTSP